MSKEQMAITIPASHIQQVRDRYKTNDNMLQVAQEECMELAQAISKELRIWQGTCDSISLSQARSNIIGELTDVSVCLMSLLKIFDISQEDIDECILAKARRDDFDLRGYGV